jgi:hypothetical protein
MSGLPKEFGAILSRNAFNLIARIDLQGSWPNCEYAFYLMKGKERLAVRWYGSEQSATFALPDEPMSVYAVAFVRIKGSKEVRRASSVDIETSAISVGQVPLTAFRQIVMGDYELQEKKGFRPRADTPAVALKVPFKWTGYKDRNAEFVIHSWRFLCPIWNRLTPTGDPKYLGEALSYILDWNAWLKSGRTSSSFAWNDMATGIRAMHLAFALQAVRAFPSDIDAGMRAMLADIAGNHLEKLLQESFISIGNHAVYQIAGLRLLCVAGDDADANLAYCERHMRKLLDESFDSHGVHTENSPFYHQYVIHLFSFIHPPLFPSLSETIREILKKARTVTSWLTAPNGHFFQIGDSEGVGPSLRMGSEGCDFEERGVRYVSKDLSDSGYVVMRSHPDTPIGDATALVVHATNKTLVHSHADHLSFIFFHRGIELFADSGKYNYEFDKWRDYFVGDSAHNSVGLEGRRFGPKDVRLGAAHLDALTVAGSHYLVQGSVQKGADDEFRHQRRLELYPGKRLVIQDHVENRGQERVEVRFHLGIGVEAEARDSEVVLRGPNGELGVLRCDPALLELRLDRGLDADEIQGWISKQYKVKNSAWVVRAIYPSDIAKIDSEIVLR